MFPKKRSFVAAAILALAAFGTNSNPSFAQDDKVVAKVNGTTITEADMRFANAEIGAQLGDIPENVKRRALAEYLIDNALFAEAAIAAKIAADPAFEEQMQYVRRRLLREQYFEKQLKGVISEADAKKIYDQRVAQLKSENEVAARHILVDNEEKAIEILAKIKAGGDFAALAKENSTDTGSKEQGGFLGYFGRGQMVPEFEKAAFTMIKGQVSEPVKTNFGWHIIKLEDRRRKPPPSFDDVKETILNSLAVLKAQEVVAALRKKADVEYLDDDIKKQVEEQEKKKAAEAKTKPTESGAAPKQ
ncbi:MAG: peptidylprolyl isomerase [Hyphomicrobium sp.]